MDSDLRISGFIEKKLGSVLMITALFHVITSILIPFVGFSSTLRIVAAVGLSIFVAFHGSYRYKWEKMIIFLVITFLVSWIFETISINTGFPFGKYYYTELLGGKAGVVPWGIMFAYFLTGYLSWTIANIFTGETNRGISKKNLFIIPVIAAILMVFWDVCFDPIMSTIEGNWIWESGGAYFGVPISNFLGWFLSSYIIFQLFALFIYKSNDNEEIYTKKFYWYLIPIAYAGQGVEYLIHPFIRLYNTEIYRASLVTTLITMIGVSLVCLFVIYKRQKTIK